MEKIIIATAIAARDANAHGETDFHIAGPGAVGVWSEADGVTVFDDFSYGATAR